MDVLRGCRVAAVVEILHEGFHGGLACKDVQYARCAEQRGRHDEPQHLKGVFLPPYATRAPVVHDDQRNYAWSRELGHLVGPHEDDMGHSCGGVAAVGEKKRTEHQQKPHQRGVRLDPERQHRVRDHREEAGEERNENDYSSYHDSRRFVDNLLKNIRGIPVFAVNIGLKS